MTPGLDLGPIEKRAQERIDIVAEHGGLIPQVEEDRVKLLAEVCALRERVATLEEGIEAHRRWVRQRDASGWMHKGTPHQAPNERLWSLLDVQGDGWCRDESCRHRHWRSGDMPTHRRGEDCPLLDVQGDTEGER